MRKARAILHVDVDSFYVEAVHLEQMNFARAQAFNKQTATALDANKLGASLVLIDRSG